MSGLVGVCFKGHDTAGKVLADLQQMEKYRGQFLRTSLSTKQEQELRQALAQ
jgi:uncharacterized membrane protein